MADSPFIARFLLESSSWQKGILLTAKHKMIHKISLPICAYFCIFPFLGQRGPDPGSSLTCLCYLHQFVIAEFVEVLFHLRDRLSDGAKGEVGIHTDCGQLLGVCLGCQHVVGLTKENIAIQLWKCILSVIFQYTGCINYSKNCIYISPCNRLWNKTLWNWETVLWNYCRPHLFGIRHVLSRQSSKPLLRLFKNLKLAAGVLSNWLCDCISARCLTWMKWMWSSVRDSWVISLSLLFRSAISWVRRSMWPSALLSAALLLVEISLVISCCILSMERIMSLNIFSHSCRALWAEFCRENMQACHKSSGCHTGFTSAQR